LLGISAILGFGILYYATTKKSCEDDKYEEDVPEEFDDAFKKPSKKKRNFPEHPSPPGSGKRWTPLKC
jgi:hypothetical protein